MLDMPVHIVSGRKLVPVKEPAVSEAFFDFRASSSDSVIPLFKLDMRFLIKRYDAVHEVVISCGCGKLVVNPQPACKIRLLESFRSHLSSE